MLNDSYCDFRSVLFLGVGIFFLYSMIEGISAAGPHIYPHFQGKYDPFLALLLNYLALLITAVLSPVYSYLFTTKTTIILGAINLYVFGILQLIPLEFVTYVNNFQSGFNAGVMWTSVGKAITVHSDRNTIHQHTAVLFFFFKSSVVLANFLRLVFFNDEQLFTHMFQKRDVSFLVLSIAIGTLGLILLFLYHDPAGTNTDEKGSPKLKKGTAYKTIVRAFWEATEGVKLSFPEKVLLYMYPIFFLDGMTVEFWRTLSGTTIDKQQTSKDLRRQKEEMEFYMDIAALLVGIGEIVAAFLRFMVPKCLSPEFLLEFFLCCGGSALCFSMLMLLRLIPIHTDLWEPTAENIDFTNLFTAFCFCSTNIFFGFYDCIIETEIYVCLASWFPGNLENNQAFAVYQFVCTIGGVVMVYLYKTMHIPWVICIISFNFLFCAVGILVAERRVNDRKMIENYPQQL